MSGSHSTDERVGILSDDRSHIGFRDIRKIAFLLDKCLFPLSLESSYDFQGVCLHSSDREICHIAGIIGSGEAVSDILSSERVGYDRIPMDNNTRCNTYSCIGFCTDTEIDKRVSIEVCSILFIEELLIYGIGNIYLILELIYIIGRYTAFLFHS